jgi:hypothetical protein
MQKVMLVKCLIVKNTIYNEAVKVILKKNYNIVKY